MARKEKLLVEIYNLRNQIAEIKGNTIVKSIISANSQDWLASSSVLNHQALCRCYASSTCSSTYRRVGAVLHVALRFELFPVGSTVSTYGGGVVFCRQIAIESV